MLSWIMGRSCVGATIMRRARRAGGSRRRTATGLHYGRAMNRSRGPVRALAALVLLACAPAAVAQFVDDSRERYAFDSPEGWAMAWVTASTIMAAGGATPALGPGELQAGVDLGSIPWLDEEQQRVGFGGFKDEDLNKSPAFGRLRGWVGLPAGFVLELGWTPPLRVDGAKPEDLFAAALGRRLWEGSRWDLSARLHGQYGRARGDITCPRAIAGRTDPIVNPFRCVAPSDDRIDLRYHALDATFAHAVADGARGHVTLGVVRVEPRVQVNARSPTLLSVPRLSTRGSAPYVAAGITGSIAAGWEIGAEALWLPLDVRRDADGAAEDDAFWSVRISLRHRWRD
jgi:hypothetical protein